MNIKTLGLLALAGAPFFLLSTWLQPYFSFLHERQFYGAWSIIYITAWMCSIRGLQLLKATGTNRWGKAILWVQLTALLLANLSNLHQLLLPGADTALFFVLDAFWPISNGLMLITGITVAAAGRLRGFSRYVPLLVGLWLPVLVVCINLFGRTGTTGLVTGIYSAIAWSLLAITIIRNAHMAPNKQKATPMATLTTPHLPFS